MPTVSSEQAIALNQYLMGEIYRTLGLSPTGFARKLTGPIFSHPIQRISHIAGEFDARIERLGIRAAFEWLLSFFAKGYQTTGQEHLPTEGPLLVIANHPGTMDTILISSILPRNDLKIIAGYSPFTQNLPNLRNHLIYSAPDMNARAAVVRTAIHHLNATEQSKASKTGHAVSNSSCARFLQPISSVPSSAMCCSPNFSAIPSPGFANTPKIANAWQNFSKPFTSCSSRNTSCPLQP